MADRMVALIGPGKGPRICTKRMAGMKVRLSGFKAGLVRVFAGDPAGGIKGFEHVEGCEFYIPPSLWIQVEYLGRDKTFISTIYSEG